ncbi:MAG: hypothetical protein QXK66_05820 [Sulfolobales archaeon]
MSLLRDFAYAFVVSKKAKEFGLLAKVLTPVLLISFLSLPYVAPGLEISTVQTLLALTYETVVAIYLAGSRKLVGILKLVGMIIALGFALNLVSILLGSDPAEPVTMGLRALRVATIVLALTLLFQLLTVGEIKYLLLKMGLKRYSEVFAVSMALLPITFINFSEAYVVARLKLGKKNIASLIKPLMIDSIINSRHMAEALYIHGIPPPLRPKLVTSKDLAILVPAILVSLSYIVIPL